MFDSDVLRRISYVNVIVVVFYLLEVALITTQVSLSQIFKYRLHFQTWIMFLNQRLCISTHCMHCGVLRENLYYHTANWENLPSYRSASSQEANFSPLATRKSSSKDPAQAMFPSSMPLSDSVSFRESTYWAKPFKSFRVGCSGL